MASGSVASGMTRFHLWSARQAFFLVFLLLLIDSAFAVTLVSSVRVWPADEYTRLTLESDKPIPFRSFMIKDPERFVLDLENVELNTVLDGIASKIAATDPYIKLVRVGRYKPNVVRLVLELKAEVKPQVFSLQPVGEYGHRLVLDIYPAKPVDPLMALVQTPSAEQAAAGAPAATIPPTSTASGPSEAPAGQEAGRPLASADPKPVDAPKKAGTDKTDKAEKSDKAEAVARKDKVQSNMIRLITVAIDAGHGGEDPGAIGKNGTREKDVTLAIARRLKARIDKEPNMRAVLVRDGDYFIPLHSRVIKARNVQADLFVSIHADAFIKPHARGSSVFALSERGATSAAARWLAKRENDADLIGGVNLDVKDPYLAKTLLDLSQTATINDSLKLGKEVLTELGTVNTLHKAAVEQAGFAVLKAPDIPSILVETAFITNPDEERRLTDDAYQEKMAAAIVSGIKRYFANNPPIARSRLAQF